MMESNPLARVITLTLQDSLLQPSGTLAGYTGEHCATRLQLEIPQNLLTDTYTYQLSISAGGITRRALLQYNNLVFDLPVAVMVTGAIFVSLIIADSTQIIRKTDVCQLMVAPALDVPSDDIDNRYTGLLEDSIDQFKAATAQLDAVTVNTPYVDADSGNWMVYSTEKKSYTDTGIYAKGIQGDKGDKGDPGSITDDSVDTSHIKPHAVTPEKCAFLDFDPNGQLFFESQFDYLGYIYNQTGGKIYGAYPTIRFEKSYFDFENRVYRIACNVYVTFWKADGTFVNGYARTSVTAANSATITGIETDYDYVLLGLVGSDKRMYGLPKGTLLATFKQKFADNTPNLYHLDNTILDATLLNGYTVSSNGNLIDKKTIINGVHITSAGAGGTGHNETDFIPIDPAKKYRLNFKAIPVFYTADKNYISGYNETVAVPDNPRPLTVPYNAAYMRTMIYDSQLSTAVLAENNYFCNDAPTYYTLNGVGDIGAYNAKKDTNPLYGKTAVFFGDSTTAGSGNAAGGWSGWIFLHNTSMTCINCGVYGSTFGGASDKWFDASTNQASLPDNSDYVIIQAYTNGMYGSNPQKPIGAISEYDYTVTIDTADTSTYSGEAEKFVLQCLSRWHGKKLGMIIGYKAVAHLAQNSPYRQFAAQMLVLCRKYSLPVLNLQECSTIPCYTREQIDTYFYKPSGQTHGDGTHLNAKGNAIVSEKIEAWMKTL